MSSPINDVNTQFEQAVNFFKNGKYQNAKATFEQCLRRNPDAVIRLRINQWLCQCNTELSWNSQASQGTKDHLEAMFTSAVTYRSLGNHEHALGLIQKIIKDSSNLDISLAIKTHQLMRTLYEEMGLWREAVETVQKIYDLIEKQKVGVVFC